MQTFIGRWVYLWTLRCATDAHTHTHTRTYECLSAVIPLWNILSCRNIEIPLGFQKFVFVVVVVSFAFIWKSRIMCSDQSNECIFSCSAWFWYRIESTVKVSNSAVTAVNSFYRIPYLSIRGTSHESQYLHSLVFCDEFFSFE